jgi:hypothetical protein
MKSRNLSKVCVLAIVALVVVVAMGFQANAGDVTGPNWHHDRVEANTTDVYKVTFEGGVEAGVAIIGDGDTDLDLSILDSNGNEVVSQTDLTDACFVEWTPSRTAEYQIKITNLGDVYNEYLLMSN